MKLQFKFSADATNDDRERLLASLSDDGADAVEPVFRDTDEVELSLHYRARADDRNAKKVLRRLQRSRVVEYAEPQPERHLVMPIELEQQMNGAAARRRR